MNDICVGDYIRTIQGYIAKVGKIDNDFIYCDSSLYMDGYGEESDLLPINMKLLDGTLVKGIKKVKKHSKNIIDLIEVNDILKIEISKEWTDDKDRIKIICVGPTFTIKGIIKDIENGLYKIKSIVTKEQFSSMQYIVKED